MIALALLFAAAPNLKTCADKPLPPMPASEACEVIRRTLYPNCRFRLSAAEVQALSAENKTKLTAVKLFFRNCPQAKAC